MLLTDVNVWEIYLNSARDENEVKPEEMEPIDISERKSIFDENFWQKCRRTRIYIAKKFA